MQAQQVEAVFSSVPNGIELYKFIANNTIYPKEAQEKGVEENVIVNVIIEEDGTLSDVKLIYKYDFEFAEEAIRVINLFSKWIPIQIDEKNVRTKYVILVKFPPDSTFINIDSTKITSHSYNLLSRFYSIDFPKSSSSNSSIGCSFSLHLCKNGNYYIDLMYGDYEVHTIYPLSFGKYDIINDTVVLTDSYYKYQLLFQLDSCLIPIQTYPFMKELVYKDYYKVCNLGGEKHKEEIPIEKKIKDFKTANIHQCNRFEENIYRYVSFGTRCELKLFFDNEYKLNFAVNSMSLFPSSMDLHLILSTGTWERNGNILTLWDTNLQHNFYGLIREDGIELLFFRWVDDMIFKKM
jgi:hypothetical protein